MNVKTEETKTCNRCFEDQPISQFHRDRAKADGHRSICKTCKSAYDTSPEQADRRRQSVYRWRRENPERFAAYNKASAAKRQAYNEAHRDNDLPEGWQEIVKAFYGKCLVPGCTRTDLTVDHIIPISQNGPHDFSNFQCLCLAHNSKKHTKVIDYRNGLVMA